MSRRGVVDLRQYTAHPGRRDVLIDIFDQYFVEGQEQVGMHIVGEFRDLEDADRFVWLRGFDDMPARQHALEGFYYGPVWQAHRETANATMADSSDALLLRPVRCESGYPEYGSGRPVPDAEDSTVPTSVAITVHHLADAVDQDAIAETFLSRAVPILSGAGAETIAVLVTDPSENNFPVLPLRQERVLVWIGRFADDGAHRRHRVALADSVEWQELSALLAQVSSGLPPQELRLRPTRRSQLR